MLYDFTYMWNLKKWNKHNETEIENKQVVARGKSWVGKKWVQEIKKFKLPVAK